MRDHSPSSRLANFSLGSTVCFSEFGYTELIFTLLIFRLYSGEVTVLQPYPCDHFFPFSRGWLQ